MKKILTTSLILIASLITFCIVWTFMAWNDSKKQKFKNTLLTSNEFIIMNDELKKTNQNMSNKHIMDFIKMLNKEQDQPYNNFCIRKAHYNLDNSVNKKRLLELISWYTLWSEMPADLSKMQEVFKNPDKFRASTWLAKMPEHRCR